MSGKNELLQKEQEAFNKAAAEFEFKKKLIAVLPDDPVPQIIHNFAYCGDGAARYQGNSAQFHALRALLPAEPCTCVRGTTFTIKPTAYLREQDTGMRRAAYPVHLRYSMNGNQGRIDKADARWWSKVSDIMVEIIVDGVSREDIESSMGEDLSRYTPDSHEYDKGAQLFWLRRRKRYEDIPAASPMTQWNEAWDAFAASKGYAAKQMQFVIALRHRVSHTPDYIVPTREQAIAERFWGKLSDFATAFTETEANELLAFASATQAQLPAAKVEAQQAVKRAAEWLRSFFESRGSPVSTRTRQSIGEDAYTVLRYLFRKETGLAGQINWVQVNPVDASLEVGYTLDQEHVRVPCHWRSDAPAIDWDALAEYY